MPALLPYALTHLCLQATGDDSYLSDMNDFYTLHLYGEGSSTSMLYDWSDYFWASNTLLATLTGQSSYHSRMQYFMRQWVCGYSQVRPAAAGDP